MSTLASCYGLMLALLDALTAANALLLVDDMRLFRLPGDAPYRADLGTELASDAFLHDDVESYQ